MCGDQLHRRMLRKFFTPIVNFVKTKSVILHCCKLMLS